MLRTEVVAVMPIQEDPFLLPDDESIAATILEQGCLKSLQLLG
jgi:hypothetical protein